MAGGTAETPGAAVVEGGGGGGSGVLDGRSSDRDSLCGGFECRSGHRRRGKILKCEILGFGKFKCYSFIAGE